MSWFRSRKRRCRLSISLLILSVLLLLKPFSVTASAGRLAVKEAQGKTISSNRFLTDYFYRLPPSLGENPLYHLLWSWFSGVRLSFMLQESLLLSNAHQMVKAAWARISLVTKTKMI